MSLEAAEFLKAIGEILDSVGDNDFLPRLGEILDRRSGLGMVQTQMVDQTSGTTSGTFFSRGYAMGVVGEYERWVLGTDPRIAAIQAMPGVFKPCWQWIESESFEKSEIVRGWLDRPDIDMRWGSAGMLPLDDQQAVVVAAMRPRGLGAHTEREVSPLAAFMPLVVKAANLHLTLRSHTGARMEFLAACSRRGEAALLMDSSQRIVDLNAEADALLSEGTLRRGHGGSLEIADSGGHAAFAAAFRTALSLPRSLASNLPFKIGKNGAESIGRVLPIGPVSAGKGFPPRSFAALLISRADQTGGQAVELSRLGLTPRERELALALAAGETLADYSARRRISVETARVQLKSSMSKLGVRRQVDLVRLVLRST